MEFDYNSKKTLSMVNSATAEERELSDLFFDMTASLYVLAVKIKGFHWNVVGDQFFPLHPMLDCQAANLLEFADESAELVRIIDRSVAPVGMAEMVDHSFIKETKASTVIKAEKFLPVLISDYKNMIEYCREVIAESDKAKRQDLSDFAIKLSQYFDKWIWQFDSSVR